MKPAGLVTAALALAGCSGGDSGPRAFCDSFGAGATYEWVDCTYCTIENPTFAYDGDLHTAAGIVPTMSDVNTLARLNARNPPAPPIAAGGEPGVWLTQPDGLFVGGKTFDTRLDGVDQESNGDGTGYDVTGAGGTSAELFIFFQTTKAFDEIEFSLGNRWKPGESSPYLIYEICADGGVN